MMYLSVCVSVCICVSEISALKKAVPDADLMFLHVVFINQQEGECESEI